jgi:hypothetical protein
MADWIGSFAILLLYRCFGGCFRSLFHVIWRCSLNLCVGLILTEGWSRKLDWSQQDWICLFGFEKDDRRSLECRSSVSRLLESVIACANSDEGSRPISRCREPQRIASSNNTKHMINLTFWSLNPTTLMPVGHIAVIPHHHQVYEQQCSHHRSKTSNSLATSNSGQSLFTDKILLKHQINCTTCIIDPA